jgi:hypothetical protein
VNREQWHEHVFQIARSSGLALEGSFVPNGDFEGGWLGELAARPDLIGRALEVVPHGVDIARRANRLLAESTLAGPSGHTNWAEKVATCLEPVCTAIYGDVATPLPLRLENASPGDLQPMLTAELEEALMDALEEAGLAEWPNTLYEPLHVLLGGELTSVWYCLVPYVAELEEPWQRSVVEALEQWPEGCRTTLRPVRSAKLGRWFLKEVGRNTGREDQGPP